MKQAVFGTKERYILTADTDGTTRLFDINDRRPLVTKTNPGQTIIQIAFRPDVDRHARVLLIGNQARRGPSFSNQQGQGPSVPVANPPGRLSSPVVTEWRLTRAAAPSEHFDPLSQWTASRKLDDTTFRTELTSLSQDAIFDLWKNTEARPELTRALSGDELSEWHGREAALCELDERWGPAVDHWTRALSIPSVHRRPMLLARRARAYGILENWTSAEHDLDAALSLISEDSELRLARAYARIQLSHPKSERTKLDHNKLEEAIGDFQRALRTHPENGMARAELADAFALAGRFMESLAEYTRAIELDKTNPDLLLKRAQTFLKSDDRRFDLAYADFLVAGRLFRDSRRLDDADRAYSGAIGLFKKGVERSRKLRAKIHAELAGVAESRAYIKPGPERHNAFEFAAENYSDATDLDDTVWTYWNGLARCHGQLEEWKEASQAFEKALELNPRDRNLAVSRAGSLVKLKDWDGAAKAYSNIITGQPEDPSHHHFLATTLAAVYLQPIPPEKQVRPEHLEAARLCLVEAAKDEHLSKQSILWSHLAVIELAARRIDDYRATVARMLDLFKNPIANDSNNLAWVVALAKGTPAAVDHAIKLAETAVSASPQNYNYLNTYGAVLYRAGRREESIKRLEEASIQRARAPLLSPSWRAHGDALDKLFIAMAQYTPEQPESARQTLKLAIQTIDRVRAAEQSETPEQSLEWVWQRLEFDILRREAEDLIDH